jgi:hypothetical protein
MGLDLMISSALMNFVLMMRTIAVRWCFPSMVSMSSTPSLIRSSKSFSLMYRGRASIRAERNALLPR